MAREIRVTFTDKEEDLYNYIVSKSSKSGFLKDLAYTEKRREEKYINSSLDEVANKIADKLKYFEIVEEVKKDINNLKELKEELKNIEIKVNYINNESVKEVPKEDTIELKEESEYDFGIDDLGLDI